MKWDQKHYSFLSILLGIVGIFLCFFASLPYGAHSHAEAHGWLGISICAISLILMILNEQNTALSNLFFGVAFGGFAALIDQYKLVQGMIGLGLLGIAYYFLLKVNHAKNN